jgi:hypothetical protein
VTTTELRAEEVLALHADILFVTYGNVRGKVIFRERNSHAKTKLEEPDSEILLLFDLLAEHLTETHRRLERFTGKAKSVIISYERFSQTIVFNGDRYMVGVFNKETDHQTIRSVSEKMLTLLSGPASPSQLP